MDEMVLSLGSKLMKKIITKLLAKFIKKQIGCDVEIELDELKVNYNDGDVSIKTNVELKMGRTDMKKLLVKLEESI